jgi:hypothetical protein
MVVVSYSGREINAKVVYYGPGLSGKTTNLEKIYDSVPETNRGRMVSMKTQTDRTLFFDLLPLDLGELSGMKTRFLLYTVPGQVYYNATRKLVLKGVDAIVFVADSAPDKMAENRESLTNLETNLKAYGLDLRSIPWVIQFNKRDLPSAMTVEQMNQELNRYKVPVYEAQAANGVGVFETLRGVSKLLLSKISKDVVERDRGSLAASARVSSEVATKPAADEVAPSSSTADPKKGRGKLMQLLKRGKGEEEPAAEAPAAHGGPAAHGAPPEPTLLADDAVVEEPPVRGPVPTYVEPTPMPEPPAVEPAPSAADEAMILSHDDLIVEREEPQEHQFVRGSGDQGVFEAGEIERESTYEADRSAGAAASAGQTITIPIDLGALPASGQLKVTFQIKVEIEEESPKKRRKQKSGQMRDLDPVT